MGQKDNFEFIHKQKAVERARVCMGSKSRETKNVGRQITTGFRVQELFTWTEVTWPASGPVIHRTCTDTFVSTASRQGFTEHTTAQETTLFSCVTIFSDSALTSDTK